MNEVPEAPWVIEPEHVRAFGELDAFHVLALLLIVGLIAFIVWTIRRNGKSSTKPGPDGKTTRVMTNHDLSDMYGKIDDVEDKLRGEMRDGHKEIQDNVFALGKQVAKVEAGQDNLQRSLDRIANALGPRAVAGDD